MGSRASIWDQEHQCGIKSFYMGPGLFIWDQERHEGQGRIPVRAGGSYGAISVHMGPGASLWGWEHSYRAGSSHRCPVVPL